MKIADVMAALERRAPSGTAEEWDNVGLLVGDAETQTSGAVVSVDLTDEAIDAAVAKGWKLVVNHHPCIFPRSRGLSKVTAGSSASRRVHRAIQEGISVVSCHTNFDQCSLEVVRAVSEGLKVEVKGRLIDSGSASLLKLVVFVPVSHVEAVRQAICAAGAGQIGQYDRCTFGVRGEGTFRAGPGTEPFLGQVGTLERAEEVRLETVLPRGLRAGVVRALLQAHPYEEVAYDLYLVEQRPSGQGQTWGLGYGFWGELPKPRSFADVARDVKRLFKVDGFWVSEPVASRIRRLGFVAGKGSSFVGAAASAGCDLLITGEAGYHSQLDGARQGVTVLELGHRESERFYLSTMRDWLQEEGLKTLLLDVPTQKIWTGGKK